MSERSPETRTSQGGYNPPTQRPVGGALRHEARQRQAANRGGDIDDAASDSRRRVAPALQGFGGPGYAC